MSDSCGVKVLQYSQGLANSYIVSHAGTFAMNATRGTSTTSVGSVSSVEVLWESFGTDVVPKTGDLIKSVSYNSGAITFQTADTYKEGNAVIVARDVNGDILWSWHIWFTDVPKSQTYYKKAGIMMDRNLGATSATPGDVGALGLFYQWGRKDPFLGACSKSNNIRAASTINWPSLVRSSTTTGTIQYSIENPTTFISANNSNEDWYYPGSSMLGNARWTTSSNSKSIYDPCPAGWRVPDGGESGIWSKAVGLFSVYRTNFNYGIDFYDYFGDTTIWYPAAGMVGSGSGQIKSVGDDGIYWSATTCDEPQGAFILNFDNSEIKFSSSRAVRACGLSVRCVKE